MPMPITANAASRPAHPVCALDQDAAAFCAVQAAGHWASEYRPQAPLASRIAAFAAASPPASGSKRQCVIAGIGSRSSTLTYKPLPAAECHACSPRPRPAVCSSAKNTDPCGAPLRAAAMRITVRRTCRPEVKRSLPANMVPASAASTAARSNMHAQTYSAVMRMRDVHRARRVRQRANGDKVDPRLAHTPRMFSSSCRPRPPSASSATPLDPVHCFLHLRRRHVVEQDRLRAASIACSSSRALRTSTCTPGPPCGLPARAPARSRNPPPSEMWLFLIRMPPDRSSR